MLGLLSHSDQNKNSTGLHQSAGALPEKDFLRGDSEFQSTRNAEYYQAAQILIENREYRSAHKLLRQILEESPLSVLTLKSLGHCSEKLELHNECIALYTQLLAIDNCARNYFLLGRSYSNNNQDELALPNYLKAIEITINDDSLLFELHKNIGNIFVKCHDFDSAEENYHKAFAIHSKSAQLLVNYGTLEVQRGNWNSAILRFREAVTIDAKNDSAWVGLAIVHRQFGDFDLSWANLEQAIELQPCNRTALQLALHWVVREQKWYRVSQWLENFLSVHDSDAEMSMALAQIWYVTGHLGRARLEITRTLALEPMMESAAQLLNLVIQEESSRSHGGEIDRNNNGT